MLFIFVPGVPDNVKQSVCSSLVSWTQLSQSFAHQPFWTNNKCPWCTSELIRSVPPSMSHINVINLSDVLFIYFKPKFTESVLILNLMKFWWQLSSEVSLFLTNSSTILKVKKLDNGARCLMLPPTLRGSTFGPWRSWRMLIWDRRCPSCSRVSPWTSLTTVKRKLNPMEINSSFLNQSMKFDVIMMLNMIK